MKEIVHESDLCDLIILTNRRLNKALRMDMSGEGIGANIRQTEVNRHVGEIERSPGSSDEQREPGGLERGLDGEERDPGVPVRLRCIVDADARHFQDTPCAGEATQTCIENALPDMGRLSRATRRWVHGTSIYGCWTEWGC